METKTCIVTGASSGLGLATAVALARAAQNVVMVCREGSRGERAREGIVLAAGVGAVELSLADLSSQQSIRGFAANFERTHGGSTC